MPQIAQLAETYSSQVFWMLVIFGLIFFVVGRGMVPKVMATVSLRDAQIAGDLAAAEEARKQADQEELAWRERENANRAQAQALIGSAKADATAASDKKLAAAQKRIDKKLAEADEAIAVARDAAFAEIETVASEAAQDIALKIAGVKVTSAAATSAVKKALING